MAVKTRDEILEIVKNRIGDSTEDSDIEFLEDVTDTFDDLENKAKGDGVDWKTKYEENDKMWKEKYRNRFFSSNDEDEKEEDEEEENRKPKTFAELFTTV